MENGIFQLWHRKSKKGSMYTAIVAVDKFGKLSFNFDLHYIALCVNAFSDHIKALGFCGYHDLMNSSEEFIIDFDKFKVKE